MILGNAHREGKEKGFGDRGRLQRLAILLNLDFDHG
jgi:hypothetical protein